MAKAAKSKKKEAEFEVGTVVRFLGYSDADTAGETFQEGDLIKLVKVPENYAEEAMDGYVIERNGQNVDDEKLGEQFYANEVEIVGTYDEWKEQNAQEGGTAEEEAEAVKPKAKAKKEKPAPAPKTPKVATRIEDEPEEETVEAEPEPEAKVPAKTKSKGKAVELVPEETNKLMTYLNRVDLHEAALELAKVHYVSDTVLSAVLARIHNDRLYEQHVDGEGEDVNFETYIEQHFSDTIGYRKALYLVKSYNFLTKYNLDVDMIKELGYAKIQKLLVLDRVEHQHLLEADPDLIKKLAKKAKTIGRDQLKEEIDEITEDVNASDETRKLTHVKLSMFEDNYAEYHRLLGVYRVENSVPDEVGDQQVLVSIMQEWENNLVGTIPSLEQDKENFEARHNVKIEIKK